MEQIGSSLKRASRWGTVLGIVLVVLGVLSIASPLATGIAVSVLVGVLMIAAGIGRLIWAFDTGSFGKGALTFLLGALLVAAGLLLVFRPMFGVASLAMVLAAFFLADGIVEVIGGFKLRPASGWGWLLFGGIASIVLAGLIWWQWPLSGAWAIGVLVGVKLIFAGVAMIAVGSVGRQLANRAGAAA